MKKRDAWIILAVMMLAGALLLIGQKKAQHGGNAFLVTIDGTEALHASLSSEATYPVRQEDGSYNLLQVSDGMVWMKEANCRDGLCIRQGKTATPAKTIVCLPHKLVVTVISENAMTTDDLDIVVQ